MPIYIPRAHAPRCFPLTMNVENSDYMSAFKHEVNTTYFQVPFPFCFDAVKILVDDGAGPFRNVTVKQAKDEGLFAGLAENRWALYTSMTYKINPDTQEGLNMMNEFPPVFDGNLYVREDNWDIIVHNDELIGLKIYAYVFDQAEYNQNNHAEPINNGPAQYFIMFKVWSPNTGWTTLEHEYHVIEQSDLFTIHDSEVVAI